VDLVAAMKRPRFKIDFNDYFNEPFALYFDEGGWRPIWRKVNSYKTKDEAVAFYDKVKDLPEYLP
jgi:hypothetical protein